MKRSIKLFAALALLSATLFSCSDDPDASPDIPVIQSEVDQSILQGDWIAVSKEETKDHTLHFDGEVAVQKTPDGTVARASFFALVDKDGKKSIAYGQNLFQDINIQNVPNFFNQTEIVSVSGDELILGGKFPQTFKRMDPVN